MLQMWAQSLSHSCSLLVCVVFLFFKRTLRRCQDNVFYACQLLQYHPPWNAIHRSLLFKKTIYIIAKTILGISRLYVMKVKKKMLSCPKRHLETMNYLNLCFSSIPIIKFPIYPLMLLWFWVYWCLSIRFFLDLISGVCVRWHIYERWCIHLHSINC